MALASPADARRPEAIFREGVQAADREEWALVERAMRRAIQLDGQESSRPVAITGMRFEWYLPHYFLGLALFEQGDRAGARQAWEVSRQQGVVFEWRESAWFEQKWKKVEGVPLPAGRSGSRRPRPEPAVTPPPTPADRLDAAILAIERRLADLGPPRADTAAILVDAAEALTDLEIARQGNAVPSDEETSRWADRLEAIAKSLVGLSPAQRSTADLVETMRDLVERVRDRGDVSAVLDDRLVDIEIELSRNEPDRSKLAEHEAALLEHLFPILATLHQES